MAWGSGTRQWLRALRASIGTSTTVLGQGELLVADDGGIAGGDGSTQVKNLSFAATQAWALPVTQKGAASGLASLDSSSVVVQQPRPHAARHAPGGADDLSATYALTGTYAPVNAIDPMSAPYNAAGDGVTGDSTAIRAAVTAAALTGAVVRPRSGHTFLIDSTVTFAGCTFDGNGCMFKAAPGLSAPGNIFFIGSNTTVKNCKFDGNGINVAAIHANNGGVMSNVKILDNEVTNCGVASIWSDATTSSSDITIRGNYIHDTGGPGMWVLSGPQYRLDVSNNIVRNVGSGTGIHISGSSSVNAMFGLKVTGNIIDVPGMIPLEVFYANGFSVTGNIIKAGTLGFGLANGLHGTISGNMFQNQTYGIEFNDGNDTVAITGNSFDQCGIAIFLDGSGIVSNNVTISGNTIARGQQAIWLAVGCLHNRVLISGNTLVDQTTRGIEVRSTVTDLVITGNSYIVSAAVTLVGNACFVMINGTTTRGTITDNVLSLIKTSTDGNTVGVIRVIATFTNGTIAGNTITGIGTQLAQSAIFVGAVSCLRLRIARNRIVDFSDGIITNLATNDDVTVIDNFIDPTVTTPYTLKSTHLLKSKLRFEMTAAPTVGTWSRGDEIRNSAPAVGSPKAWLCTVAGTPGTWVSTGNL